jgi:hypothetical protein
MVYCATIPSNLLYVRRGGKPVWCGNSVRFYAMFGVRNMHSLTHPGWANYAWYPKWLIRFDTTVMPHVFKWTGMRRAFSVWQPFVYSLAYKRALRRWPHLQAEILCDADWPELIRGHTRRDGNDLHILDTDGKVVSTWTTV